MYDYLPRSLEYAIIKTTDNLTSKINYDGQIAWLTR